MLIGKGLYELLHTLKVETANSTLPSLEKFLRFSKRLWSSPHLVRQCRPNERGEDEGRTGGSDRVRAMRPSGTRRRRARPGPEARRRRTDALAAARARTTRCPQRRGGRPGLTIMSAKTTRRRRRCPAYSAKGRSLASGVFM